jgi:hypothetical protein
MKHIAQGLHNSDKSCHARICHPLEQPCHCLQEIVKPPRAAPSTEQLVSGAVSVLEKVPIAAFSLADLLLSHAGKDMGCESAVMSSLLMLIRYEA